MNDRKLQTIEQVRQFMRGSEALEFRALPVGEKYDWIEEVMIRFRYHWLKRAEKGVIRRYIERITGYSRSQVSRLITEYKRRGRLKQMPYRRHRFPRKYTPIEQKSVLFNDNSVHHTERHFVISLSFEREGSIIPK